MRERDINRKLFSAGHYNILAAQIKGKFPLENDSMSLTQRATLTDLALSMAKRFTLDNDQFDPLRFLDACSPNLEFYPLSELWEGVNKEELITE